MKTETQSYRTDVKAAICDGFLRHLPGTTEDRAPGITLIHITSLFRGCRKGGRGSAAGSSLGAPLRHQNFLARIYGLLRRDIVEATQIIHGNAIFLCNPI